MASSTQWRLLAVLTNSTTLALAEVKLFTVSGGADVAAGATVTAIGDDGVNPAANAVDGNGATSWVSNATSSQKWIAFDFGTGNEKEIVEYSVESHATTGKDMTRWELEWYDGTYWRSAHSVTSATWARNEVKTYTLAALGAYRYWRAHCLLNNGSSFCICAELELKESSGGADECTGGTPVYKSQAAAPNNAAAAFDDDAATFWATAGLSVSPWWIGYDFGVSVTKEIVEATWQNRTGRTDGTPYHLAIQYGSDNNEWTTKWDDVSGLIFGSGFWASGEIKTYTYTPASSVRPVVFVAT